MSAEFAMLWERLRLAAESRGQQPEPEPVDVECPARLAQPNDFGPISWWCSLPAGHAGQHEAHAFGKGPLRSW